MRCLRPTHTLRLRAASPAPRLLLLHDRDELSGGGDEVPAVGTDVRCGGGARAGRRALQIDSRRLDPALAVVVLGSLKLSLSHEAAPHNIAPGSARSRRSAAATSHPCPLPPPRRRRSVAPPTTPSHARALRCSLAPVSPRSVPRPSVAPPAGVISPTSTRSYRRRCCCGGTSCCSPGWAGTSESLEIFFYFTNRWVPYV